MATSKNRKKIAFTDETLEKLDYLIAKKQKTSKVKVYPCQVLEELINNAYTIDKTFNSSITKKKLG